MEMIFYADDIVRIAKSELQSRLTSWQHTLKSRGLKISIPKTEYMHCNFTPTTCTETKEFKLNEVTIKWCQHFKYLGYLKWRSNTSNEDAKMGWGVFRLDRIRNEYIRGSFKVAPKAEKIWDNRLKCLDTWNVAAKNI